ncbi:MAG: hypothetical protein A2138_02165 [Deltaproteobacteria bacterium RBG_16_71_12]|nr:MAG: hypothetical protein A2138_02165 [Deltaproteobacteria bacterium RBG_16_71_12]
MIVDSSAIVAVMLREPGWERLVDALAGAPSCAVGAPTLVETGIVVTAKMGPRAHVALSRLLEEADIAVVPFTEAHWRAALDAWRRFGKGRHPAGLNFGDCLSYALATLAEQPLLFVGDDFTKTDVLVA